MTLHLCPRHPYQVPTAPGSHLCRACTNNDRIVLLAQQIAAIGKTREGDEAVRKAVVP